MRGWLLVAVVLVAPGVAVAQSAQGPQTATYLQPAAAAQQVRFTRRLATRGDRADQRLDIQLELKSTTRQGETITHESNTALKRLEQRALVAEEVVEGKTVAARVRFEQSQHTLNGKEPEASIVAGKTYRCRRVGEALEVTRDDGSLVTPAEHETVAARLASLGQSNPLADYFAGKSIAVGEKLSLPKEVGAGLLGSDGTLGTVSRFEVTLREVVEEQGTKIARFDAEVEAEASDGVQMRLLVDGTIDLEVDTCRTRRLDLSGPMARMSSFGSYSQTETTTVSGKLSVRMAGAYRDNR